jgi:hypothetical protein
MLHFKTNMKNIIRSLKIAHYIIVALLLNIIILKTIETTFSSSHSKNLIEQTMEKDSIDENEVESTYLICSCRK